MNDCNPYTFLFPLIIIVVLYNYNGEYKKGLLGKQKISAKLYEDYIEGVGAEYYDGELREDPYAEYNLYQAQKAGVQIGIYFFSTAINEEVCFIWMDNTKDNRSGRYYNEHRTYNYNERDAYEKRDLGAYVKSLYAFNNSHVIYFNDELPSRVATIVYTLIKHPDMMDLYVKNFD